MQHKKVTQQWYQINFSASHRTLGGKIDEFFEGSPELDENEELAQEKWDENHTVLRDFEGDFDGIHIYHSEITKPLIEFICGKVGINYSDVKDLDFKLLG